MGRPRPRLVVLGGGKVRPPTPRGLGGRLRGLGGAWGLLGGGGRTVDTVGGAVTGMEGGPPWVFGWDSFLGGGRVVGDSGVIVEMIAGQK